METIMERKFLKFLDIKTTPLREEIDIKKFILFHFKKPNPLSEKTTNYNDDGVKLLKKLKEKGLIEYDEIALSHVNNWFVDGGDNPKIKRWFDTLHEPLYVSLTNEYYTNYKPSSFPLLLLNRRFVLYTKRYATIIAGKIWKAVVAISIILISAYLGSGNHFDMLIEWVKSFFK